MTVPWQYLPVMPYLIIENSTSFHDFMKEVFIAEDQLIIPAENGGVMHGELRIGDAVIMFANSGQSWPTFPGSVFIYVEDAEAVFNRAILKGCKQLQELAQREYGYGGGFEDHYGNNWWVNQNS